MAYVTADQLGTPRAISDSSGTTEWQWAYQGNAWGETVPTSNGYTYNLRFPGQYADAESPLVHNDFRDYCPACGRYAQSDPLGMFGGQSSTYAYASGNPLIFFDPLGLVEWSGTIKSFGGEAIVGGGFFELELTSQCVHGKKAKVKIYAAGPGVGANVEGAPAFGGTISQITFDDGLSNLNPSVFNGFFVQYDADFSFAKGYGCSIVRAGGSGAEIGSTGVPTSVGCGQEAGIGAGISATGGTSTVIDSSIIDCGCDDK